VAVHRAGLTALLFSALLALALTLPTKAHAQTCTPPVTADGPCGMDLQDAWSHYTTGDPNVVLSYIEGGINWHLSQAKQLVDSIYVNWHETPVPCDGSNMVVGGVTKPCAKVYSSAPSDYDVNHDGAVNIEDWANDPRVHDSNGNGYLDPEDLIAAFSDGVDHDHNGYVSDVSGWDFYDNQNDPGTVDSTYSHSDDQMLVIHHECPKCMIMPVKAGAEALDRTDDLAKAWLFSADAGMSVVVSTTADLGYASFMRQAVDYVQSKGIAMVESSNDFDSTDHQGGMFHQSVLPGNGVVVTSDKSKWTRSDYTSWGPHNVLSAATSGGTTSESTPTIGGVIALVMSWGRAAAAQHLISSPLTGPEAEQQLISTATRVTDPTLPWPGEPGDWNPQYGYGIPNAYKAMQSVAANTVPPGAEIDSPDWYTLYDPTKSSTVPVNGAINAPRSSSFTWTLQAGLGGDPKTWFTIGSGHGSGSFSGRLGTLALSRIPQSFWGAAFKLSNTKELETTEQYAVTLHLTVTDASGHAAEDRRAIDVHHDPTWVSGFPMKLTSSGESQPALVDLQGTGRLDIVFGDTDGYVHAIDPSTHKELPGWPVHTDPVSVLVSHAGVSPGYEPIISDVSVGDLNHNGTLDVVAATEDGRVYAFNAQGAALPGWPQTCNTAVTPPPIPRPAMPYTRLPTQGTAAGGPVLFDLGQTGKLDVIEAGWDGYVHVWQPDGSNLPGWPVKVHMPAGFTPDVGHVLVNDQKLDSPPAVAFLQGRNKPPDLVIRPQYTETLGSGIQPLPFAFVFAYHADGTPVSGWPVQLPGTIEYYGSAQEFVTEGDTAPVAADPTGTGLLPDRVTVGPVFTPPYLIGPFGLPVPYGALASWPPSGSVDVPVSFTTSGAFGKLGGLMHFSEAETGALSIATSLLVPNSGNAIKNYDSSFLGLGGPSLFSAKRQGIDFLGEPIIAPVTSGSAESVVDGGDSNAMHAYSATGAMASGFPKWTTGWTIFSPAAGDLFSNGHDDLVTTTREGYLFAWSTNGSSSANTQWWRLQHDEWNTGNYQTVSRPPGAIRAATFTPATGSLAFKAPGSSWYSGKPTSYRITLEPEGKTLTVPATVPAGSTQTLKLPAGTQRVGVQAVDVPAHARDDLLGPLRWVQ
jgi:hypothetical protein